MLTIDKITEIYFNIDNFCQNFYKAKEGHVLNQECSKKKRNRSFNMSDSEVIIILIIFHTGRFRNLKTLLYQLC